MCIRYYADRELPDKISPALQLFFIYLTTRQSNLTRHCRLNKTNSSDIQGRQLTIHNKLHQYSQPTLPPTRGFSPVQGCQIQSTGLLGGLLFLSSIAAYGLFKNNVLAGGGPAITGIFDSLPSWLHPASAFQHVARDYFDILFLLLACFLFMVNWEFQRQPIFRLYNAIIATLYIACLWLTASGSIGPAAGNTVEWAGWRWNLPEIFCVFASLGFIFSWLASVNRETTLQLSPWRWALKSALYRWFAGLTLFTVLLLLVFSHPFYLNNYYENWRLSCGYLYLIYLYLGLPYAFVTNLLRGHRFEDRSDPNFVLLILCRRLYRRLRNKTVRQSPKTNNRRIGVAMRDLLVKWFFVPLMLTFLYLECGNVFANLPRLLHALHNDLSLQPTFNYFYQSFYHGLFAMDVGVALIGYVCSSRWLNNKSKSVDPTLLGWAAALICYPPFNGVSGAYLPHDSMSGLPLMGFFQLPWLEMLMKCIILVAFTIYVWATLAFGLRFSNLTNRGIITTGPYSLIRHPAYITKNIAWWLESLSRFVSPWQLLFLAAWNSIYYLRAITEERHLMMDPDYRAYCKQVKYRFIPGIW